VATPRLAVWNLVTCSKHEALHITQANQANQSWVLFNPAFSAIGEDHFLESKKSMCLQPRNKIAAIFFAKNGAASSKSNTFASGI